MANIDNAVLSIFTVAGTGFPLRNTLSPFPPLTTPFTLAPTCILGTKLQDPDQASHITKTSLCLVSPIAP